MIGVDLGGEEAAMRIFRVHAAMTAAALLSGCTSMTGSPKPLISSITAEKLIHPYMPDQATAQLALLSTEDERRVYRNRVLSAYLMAYDARYNEFKRSLSSTKKGWGLSLDLLTLGLTGGASVWEKGSQALAAGATGSGGAKAAIDRELYAEKTLPAIFSLMDSNRLSVRAEIARGMSLPESSYTLQAGFADLMRYEAAANIDRAISQTSAAAEAAIQEAEYDYSKALNLCVVPPALSPQRTALMQSLEQFEKDAQKPGADANGLRKNIQVAAIATGDSQAQLATDKAGAFKQLTMIRDFVQSICDQASLDNYKANLKSAGVKIP